MIAGEEEITQEFDVTADKHGKMSPDCVNDILHKNTISYCDTGAAKLNSSYLNSRRWRVAYMGLVLGFMLYLYRININLALPSMIKSTHVKSHFTHSPMLNSSMMTSHLYNNSTQTPWIDSIVTSDKDVSKDEVKHEDCTSVSNSQRDTLQDGEFSWDKKTQAIILSGYYYGLVVSQVPFSWISGKFGGKHMISAATLVSAAATLLLPVMANYSAYAVVVVRIVIGICSGASLAGWYILLSRWALPEERSRFTGMVWLGQYLGTIIGYFTSGFLCANGFANGWGSVFYIHGILGTMFAVLWVYVIVEYPDEHPGISDSELQLLRSKSWSMNKTKSRKDATVPWLKILTYVPVLAVTVTNALDGFVHYLVLICLPLYMKAVLKFDIQSNGMYTSLPFVCAAVGLTVGGMLADMMISRKYLTATATRKVFQIVGLVGTAVGICLPGFMTCSQRELVIMCICICMFFQASGFSSGYPASPVDIAPRYASVIYAVSNSFGNLFGSMSIFAVAALTTNDTAAEWRVMFFIAAGCAIIAALVFGLFSSSELAPWAVEPGTEIEVIVDNDTSVTQPMIQAKCNTNQNEVAAELKMNSADV